MPAKRTIFLVIDGEPVSLADAVRSSGLPESTILSRIQRLGWSHEEAIRTPTDRRFSRSGRPKKTDRSAPKLKPSSDGRGFARWMRDGERHIVYFGKWGEEADTRYARWVAEWHANGGVAPVGSRSTTISIAELVERFLAWAEKHYVKNGKPTSEIHAFRGAAIPLVRLFGEDEAAHFRPSNLRVLQGEYAQKGYTRQTVNKYAQRVTRMFSWAVSRDLLPASVADALRHVPGLVAGRTTAPERERVAAAPLADIEATLPHLHADERKRGILEVMIRIQILGRMRPGELLGMRPELIDRSSTPWRYRVGEVNKTLHLDKRRTVRFGPDARRLLGPVLDAALTGRPLWWFPGRPGPLSVESYTRFVVAACKLAGVPRWTPSQLRKTGATEVQRRFESDRAVAAALGNTEEVARQVYVDDPEDAVASRIAEATG
jgi:integrase